MKSPKRRRENWPPQARLIVAIVAYALVVGYYAAEANEHRTWWRFLPLAAYASLLWFLLQKYFGARARSTRRITLCPKGLALVLGAFVILVAYYLIEAFNSGRWLCLLPATAFLALSLETGRKIFVRRRAKRAPTPADGG